MDYGKISIIIPVYNMSDYMGKCIESVLEQTYKNLEILIVNDASTDDSEDIIDFYVEKDNRIKKIVHKENKGLFHARITGIEASTGDYVAFLDSDDHVSVDYYRTIVKKAFEDKADIVESRFVHEDEQRDGFKFINQYNNICFDKLDGEEVQDKFFEQSGLFYHWHVVWNKLYSRELIDRSIDVLKKQTKHLIMTEDIVFSSVFFLNARSYRSIKNNYYFYLLRAMASTGIDREYTKTIKYIEDMKTSFTFVKEYLIESGNTKYLDNFKIWSKRYYRMWSDIIVKAKFDSIEEKTLMLKLEDALIKLQSEFIDVETEYLFPLKIRAPWDSGYEDLKREICSDKIEYVSFNIFETLLYKPFFESFDLFNLMEDYFHKISPKSKYLRFVDIRQEAEEDARIRITKTKPSYEDVNLEEIYNELKNKYNFTDETTSSLKNKEIELELQFAQRRNSVFEIYEMALSLGKKILFIADTYLSQDTIKIMLQNLGYKEWHKIYVSSEVRLRKGAGSLFYFIKNDLDISDSELVHIGDDRNVDKVRADRAGFRGMYFPKAIDVFLNKLEGKHTGNSVNDIFISAPNDYRDTSYYLQYSGLRSMLGVVGNGIFDNPYMSFNKNTEFNSDPYFTGYYALGMHLFQLCNWMKNEMDKRKIDKIHFLARDGYIAKQAFEIMYPEIESTYVAVSRKSLLPIIFLERENIFYLEEVISFRQHSLETLKEMMFLICKDDVDKEIIKEKGIIFSKKFSTKEECRRAIEILYDDIIDQEKLVAHCDKIKTYLKNNISKDGICFDIGYSGRLQVLICDALEFSVDTLYIHGNGEKTLQNAKIGQFNVDCFYDFVPVTSAIVRETILSGFEGSCIGYEEENDKIVPILEETNENYISEFMISTIQQAALDFVRDYNNIFKDYYNQLSYVNRDCSMPLEYYIHSENNMDKHLFSCTYCEDSIQNQNYKISLIDWWEKQNSKVMRVRKNSDDSIDTV